MRDSNYVNDYYSFTVIVRFSLRFLRRKSYMLHDFYHLKFRNKDFIRGCDLAKVVFFKV
jgi:hypothetical protein